MVQIGVLSLWAVVTIAVVIALGIGELWAYLVQSNRKTYLIIGARGGILDIMSKHSKFA